MCNLNILVRGDNYAQKDNKDFLNFYNSACYNSFILNNDNEGFYFDYKNTLLTSDTKINLFENSALFENSNFILGHQRFTTSGEGIKYAQPFKSDNFVFLHNGVLSAYAKEGHSDTYNLFQAFLKHFKRYSKRFKRATAIKRAIEKILKNKYGSFSIGIFDTEHQELYYFKNSNSRITAILHKKNECFYLTTAQENTDFLRVYDNDFKEFKIKDLNLYQIKITKKSKISVKSKGSLKTTKQTTTATTQTALNSFKEEWENYENLTEFKRTMNINQATKKNKCSYCLLDTHNTSGELGEVFCDECISEEWDLEVGECLEIPKIQTQDFHYSKNGDKILR